MISRRNFVTGLLSVPVGVAGLSVTEPALITDTVNNAVDVTFKRDGTIVQKPLSVWSKKLWSKETKEAQAVFQAFERTTTIG